MLDLMLGVLLVASFFFFLYELLKWRKESRSHIFLPKLESESGFREMRRDILELRNKLKEQEKLLRRAIKRLRHEGS